MESSLSQLRTLLKNFPPGSVASDQTAAVETALIKAWPDIAGGSEQGMRAGKLKGRTEALVWHPPNLTFEMERHGATVNSSSRADVHVWSVNVDTAVATCTLGRYRQLIPRDLSLKVKPLAEEVAQAIINGREDSRLSWREPGQLVQVLIATLIPETVKETTIARRKRFRKTLEPMLAEHGWVPAKGCRANTYEKADS